MFEFPSVNGNSVEGEIGMTLFSFYWYFLVIVKYVANMRKNTWEVFSYYGGVFLSCNYFVNKTILFQCLQKTSVLIIMLSQQNIFSPIDNMLFHNKISLW